MPHLQEIYIKGILNFRHRVAATVGILDIAGFENLHVNSFEQLCINFVNERLQNFMNDSVFRTEKKIYKEEGIPCSDVDFKSNIDIIDVFIKVINISCPVNYFIAFGIGKTVLICVKMLKGFFIVSFSF